MMNRAHVCLTTAGMLAIIVAGVTIEAASEPAMDPLTGAIFTTDCKGNLVNGNVYLHKEDVYISGGPGPQAPSGAAALPEGDYYFQVTDPSGKVLLSSDPVTQRQFTVSQDGLIVWAFHIMRPDLDSWGRYGAMVVQLKPFDSTPNPDGVYKVWVTPVECYKSLGGFVPKYCKTDNFKVEGPNEERGEQSLSIRKFKDCNANGVWDPGEDELDDWQVRVVAPDGATRVETTPVKMPAHNGGWRVSEFLRPGSCANWAQTALIVDGTPRSVDPNVTIGFVGSGLDPETHEVIFGNVPLGSITACKFYDCNADGKWDNCEPPVPGIMFVLTGRDLFADPAGPPNVTRTLYTDAGGCATFCGLYPGVYTLVEVLPAGTAACDWRPTTPTQIDDIVITCDGPDGISHLFGNVATGVTDFRTADSWHHGALADANQCPDAAQETDLRKRLAREVLLFVFNVWQHLGGEAMIEMPDGSWASTSNTIGTAVAAANSTEPDAVAKQQAALSLLEELNNSSALVYILRDFSGCLPDDEYGVVGTALCGSPLCGRTGELKN